MRYCSRCQIHYHDGQNFCAQCGAPLTQSAPPQPLPQAYALPARQNRLLFILMGAFFGAFGVHNFIVGRTGRATAQLLITLLSLGALALVSLVWAIAEICTETTNARGEPLLFNF